MRTIRLTVAYDGTAYLGWQAQPHGPTIQGRLEDAVGKLTGQRVRVDAAGRTDTGVHAVGQTASFETESRLPCERMRPGLQSYLPDDIVVREVSEMPAGWHATYAAKSKRYRYVMCDDRAPLPFLRRYAWFQRRRLDAAAMHAAAQHLLGTHDFRSFETNYPNRPSSVRTVMQASVTRVSGWSPWFAPGPLSEPVPGEGGFVCFDIVADGFLYNMVRAIAGTLVRVGQHRWTPDDVRRILHAQDRRLAGETAPPQGLSLMHVDYDSSAGPVA